MNIHAGLIIDIIIVLLFAGCISYGIKRGFMRAAYQIISLALTLFIVFAFRAPLTDYLYKSQMGQNIVTVINQKVDDAITQTDYTQNINTSVNQLGLPSFVTDGIEKTAQSAESTRSAYVKSVAENITDTLMVSLASSILFLVSKIAISALMMGLNNIFRLPILKQVNKTAGGAIGLINALLVIYIVSALVMFISPAESKTTINDTINDTYIAKYFYNNNLLMKLFTNEIGMGKGIDLSNLKNR